ncbi:MAG: HAD-IB family hydrolase [Betaproteobacteria bacterium]|nr:HAD-IB family hydrolase [Betaproteobacteria bacterium]
MKLVLFDLDNTLLAGDSDYAWGLFLIEQGLVDREQYERENERFYQQYKQGTLDIHAFLDFQLRPLSEHSLEQLQSWHRQFMSQYILPMMTLRSRALVDNALNDADLVAIITATNRFVTAPIAEEFGVKHLIATEAELRDGRYTGKSEGTPCFQSGKIARLDEWLHSMGRDLNQFEQTWFYSDSRNDLPLLEQVTHPVAVNPDAVLRQHALTHHWPILDLHAD